MKGYWWVVIIAVIALFGIFYLFRGSTTSYIPVEGKVIIIEFSDFECPFCGAAEGTNEEAISYLKSKDPSWEAPMPKLKELIAQGKVILIYKHFPLTNLHKYSWKAAEASECARDQGKFWEYHDLLFKHQNALDLTSLKSYATYLALDTGKFNSCLDKDEKYDAVKKDFDEGVKLGVTGVPAFFINGEMLSGAQPFESFKVILDRELENV